MDQCNPPEDQLARFNSKFIKRGINQCWNWEAGTIRTGYGQIYWYGRQRYAHRVSWLIHHGPIPKGMHVLHECDNPTCVNPNHLWLGTATDNMKDRDKKGRHVSIDSDKVNTAKLTWENVREIRRRWAAGGVLQRELAAEYGVKQSVISCIVNHRTWKEKNE